MVPYNTAHPRVEAAFAAVRREAFLGPGPWPLLRGRRYVTTPDDDPVYLYQDLLVPAGTMLGIVGKSGSGKSTKDSPLEEGVSSEPVSE